jgi:hypothetical protein
MKTEEFLLSDHMQDALENFAKNTFDDILRALSDLAFAAEEIGKAAIDPCGLTQEKDILLKMEQIFKDPLKLVFEKDDTIAVNDVNIF